ncbi:hypothetical protein ACFQZZ_28660 [Nocardia sp. GCM10030253]|uniref:hypothetical protein n=1 Tax=Nocardia sp. GCM10030253 TaxID=3273404 RepID=UPI00363C221E
MTSYEDYRNRIIAAQEQWNRDRESIYTSTNSLSGNFVGEFDPPKIPGPDNYDSMTLAQMVEAVDAMRPAAARQAGEAWLNIGAQLTAATTLFNLRFARTVNGDGGHGGWTGQSGAAAASAVNNYAEKSENLSGAAALVSYKLLELQTGLEQTQALMPQATQRPELQGKTLPQEGVMKSGDYTEEEATQEARRVLRTVFGQVVNQTDHGVPVLPAAPPIVDPTQPPVSPPGGTSPGSQGPTGSGEPGEAGETPDGTEEPGPDEQGVNPGQPAGTDPAATTPQSVEPASATQQPNSPANTPGSPANTPSGTGTPSPTTPTPTIPPRSTGAPSTPGRPTSPGIPNTPSTPAPGRSVSGVPQQPAANPLAASTGTNNQARGAAGTSGMAPGAAGKGKDDERETSGVKDYLINKQNGEEVTGLDSMPKSVPPVIGGDHG